MVVVMRWERGLGMSLGGSLEDNSGELLGKFPGRNSLGGGAVVLCIYVFSQFPGDI